jgi:hypothetical protein
VSAWLRQAGRGRLPDGRLILWSVAEGGRGRRWRSVTIGDGRTDEAVLLETGRDGRPGRLEVTTAAGMLTLHPEPDGMSAHGNIVAHDRVWPLAFAWSAAHAFEVLGNPLVRAAILHGLGGQVRPGAIAVLPVLVIDHALIVRPRDRRVARHSATAWELQPGAEHVEVDDAGLPGDLADARRWPLEE